MPAYAESLGFDAATTLIRITTPAWYQGLCRVQGFGCIESEIQELALKPGTTISHKLICHSKSSGISTELSLGQRYDEDPMYKYSQLVQLVRHIDPAAKRRSHCKTCMSCSLEAKTRMEAVHQVKRKAFLLHKAWGKVCMASAGIGWVGCAGRRHLTSFC